MAANLVTKIGRAALSKARRAKVSDPSRAREGARHLAELKNQALVLFGSVMPLGPQGIAQFLGIQEQLLKEKQEKGGPGAESPRVLGLLLRLSEGVGLNSGYARILRGATAAFTAQGFENARIEDILKAGDVSPRTFYQFFRNKHEVLAVFADLFLSVVVDLSRREAAREGTPEEKRERIVRVVLGGFAVVEAMAVIVISEAIRPGSPLAPLYERFREEFGALLAQTYPARRDGKKPGEVDEKWVRVRLLALMGALLELGVTSRTPLPEFEQAQQWLLEILERPG